MRALSDSVSLSLFDLSLYFTFLLFIILSYQHFFLLFTFLEVSRLKPCALPPRSWGPRTTSTFPHMERPVTRPMDSNQNLRVSWKLMNLRDFVWEIQYRIIKTTILQEKETIHCSIIIWYTILFLCLKPWRFPQQRQQWIRNGKNWKRFRRGTWRKSEVRKRWSMKQGWRAQKFISPHWWTSVIWRMPNWRQSTLWKMILDLMQYSQNKDHQQLKWLQQKSWIPYPDCQDARDKQVTRVRTDLIHAWSELYSSTLSSPFHPISFSSYSPSISSSPSCTSSTTLRAVVTLRTSPERRWTQLTNPAFSQFGFFSPFFRILWYPSVPACNSFLALVPVFASHTPSIFCTISGLLLVCPFILRDHVLPYGALPFFHEDKQ